MHHFFPIPSAHLDCVVTCFTPGVLLVLAFIGWSVFGNGQVEWKVFRNFRLNIVSLDFSPGGTYYLHRPIGLSFRHRMGRFFTRNPHTWLPISTKIKHAPVSPIFFFLSNTVRRRISESQLSEYEYSESLRLNFIFLSVFVIRFVCLFVLWSSLFMLMILLMQYL